MARINQERKKKLTPGIKKVLNKYGVKASLSILYGAELCCTIRSGRIDFRKDFKKSRDSNKYYQDVNEYTTDSSYEGESKEFFNELKKVMNRGNWDNSDAMSDYFDVGWYIGIKIGTFNKEYKLETSN